MRAKEEKMRTVALTPIGLVKRPLRAREGSHSCIIGTPCQITNSTLHLLAHAHRRDCKICLLNHLCEALTPFNINVDASILRTLAPIVLVIFNLTHTLPPPLMRARLDGRGRAAGLS